MAANSDSTSFSLPETLNPQNTIPTSQNTIPISQPALQNTIPQLALATNPFHLPQIQIISPSNQAMSIKLADNNFLMWKQ